MPFGVRAAASFIDSASRYGGSAEALTNQTLAVLDDITATELVPTLDIYAFRRARGALLPMTSFSMVVHHEGPLHGITWEIDGALRLGPNLFKLDMPNGHKKRIRVRAMAKESPGEGQARGDKRWPCAGGCCGGPKGYCSEPATTAGKLVPMGIAAMIMGGLGRRRRRSKAAGKSKPGRSDGA